MACISTELGNDFTLARNMYGRYCVPLSCAHRPAATSILQGDVYEPETISYIHAARKGGDIIHAGTFFGDFLPALSAACEPDGIVWAFEPNPANFFCTSVTMFLNELNNVFVFPTALGANAGTVLLETADALGRPLGGGSSVIAGASRAFASRACLTPVMPLDSVVPPGRTVDVIHLDVEGYELQALQGATAIIQRSRPSLILEILPGSRLLDDPWFQSAILGLGYRQVAAFHGNVVLSHAP